MITRHRRSVSVLLGLLACTGAALVAPGTALAATHQLIQGSGSSSAADVVNQWIADERAKDLQVTYTADGSAQGRRDFAEHTADFAVSDLGYQGTDPVAGTSDTSNGRAFSYLPIVAGGTALAFHIEQHGTRVTSLRLSGETIARIFARQITNWDDPRITRDNGTALPDLPIVPVQHAEGSGASYQFTRYLATEFPSIWKTPASEYFPPADGHAVAQNGSQAVADYIDSPQGNGAIGYDEYSYALDKRVPVAKVLNKAGYFTAPTQFNVAVALRRARINADKSSSGYLLQNLDGVYTNPDARTYPLSSYTYAIIPTAADDATMTTAKRQTLADFLGYGVCSGQNEVGRIGNAPLPLNLVSAALDQVRRLHDADPGVDVSTLDVRHCSNPTFTGGSTPTDILDRVAPAPPPCDSIAHNPCGTPPHVSRLAAPTRLTTVASGARRTLVTALADLTRRRPVAGATVTLWRHGSGSTVWHRVAALHTDVAGRVRAAVVTTVTSAYQFRYLGDIDHRSATSATAIIRVRRAR